MKTKGLGGSNYKMSKQTKVLCSGFIDPHKAGAFRRTMMNAELELLKFKNSKRGGDRGDKAQEPKVAVEGESS